jgi:succinylglutamic semialdehyde dehydrogenase
MKDHFVGGRWIGGTGNPLQSVNPATGGIAFSTAAAEPHEVALAFDAAHQAFRSWAAASLVERSRVAERYAEILDARKEEIAQSISRETGKPLWESRQEVGTMVQKVPISIEAYQERTGRRERSVQDALSVVTHAPHGVFAVLGPFNFPGHLPNGHIVPALLAGNAVIFKPSELAPSVGAWLAEAWDEAGLPAGVFNLLQGGRETAVALLDHRRLSGVLFTGSADTGLAIHRHFAGRPEVMLALEMGGNNPMIVLPDSDPAAAAAVVALSSFATSGQRCTCTRRLIAVEPSDRLMESLLSIARRLRVDAPDALPEPFMGPVINREAADRLLTAQKQLTVAGAQPLLVCEPTERGVPFLRPGLIDVTSLPERPDEEFFGPLLQVVRVPSFEEAINEANRTRFGLAAGLVGGSRKDFERFRREIRAGIVNWNRATTGASSAAPFGGIGLSGNHRPSAYYAADYCAYPVAGLESEILTAPLSALRADSK